MDIREYIDDKLDTLEEDQKLLGNSVAAVEVLVTKAQDKLGSFEVDITNAVENMGKMSYNITVTHFNETGMAL